MREKPTNPNYRSLLRELRATRQSTGWMPPPAGWFAASGEGALPELAGMFSRIVDEGKSYLDPIKGYASLVQDGSDDQSNQRRWADKIVHSVELMDGYFQRLSLLQLPGDEPARQTSWPEIIERVVRTCEHVNPRCVPIEVRHAATQPFTQRADTLIRILFQCVRNAIEATPRRESVCIDIEEQVFSGGTGKRKFTMTVNDAGPGIPDNLLPHIWKPFFTSKASHLGLGLPFVAAAAPTVGAAVDIQSNSGKGTTVTVVLGEQGGQP